MRKPFTEKISDRARRRLILSGARELVDAREEAGAAEGKFLDAMKNAIEFASQSEIAEACGYSAQHFNDVLHGRRGISDDFAVMFLTWCEVKFDRASQ